MFWKKKKTQQLKFFVSIGSGLNQIPLITEAKNLGFQVIGVDNSAQAPGFYYCDLKIQESIENYDGIYQILREMLVDGEIVGIMTKSYGQAIVTASYLTEKFNIPFLPFSMSTSFIDKKLMKTTFTRHNILTPYIIPNSVKTKLGRLSPGQFPIIVKPNVGHAKFNVRLINSHDELRKYSSEEHGRHENYIMEKYIKGDEIIVAGIVHDRRFHLVEVTDKKTAYPPYFIDIMHISPSRYCHLSKNIERIGQAVADAFSLVRTPLIMEFAVNEDEELFLIEAVPEFGGEFIPDILVPAASRYNLIGETIKSMTGLGFKPPSYPHGNGNAVVIRYITGKNGTLASCNPDGPNSVEGTIFSRIFKEIGSSINDPVTNLDRIGVVVVAADSVDTAVSLSERAVENFNIRIK